MKKLFYKRLRSAVKENGVTKADLIRAYVGHTYASETAAKSKVDAMLNDFCINPSGTISIYDIAACALACNCSADYLLGLTERMN